MARKIPEDRFNDLVDGATEVFIARGYRLTQMSDVAEAVGVAKGTLYGYVEGKDALFSLCLHQADHVGPIEVPAVLPLRTPERGELGAWVKERLAAESVPPRLAAALKRERATDVRAELEGLIRESYELQERNHRAIKLIDRCSDHPELHAIWQSAGREASRSALARYLTLRSESGQLRPFINLRLAARMIVEVIATWAVHIKWDRAPEDFDPDEARENAVDFLVRALIDESE
jgi:AcrR family transcriptional regulator